MSKTVKIDLSGDRLIAIAADMVDDHNYIGALKMLNKNAELTGNDEDSYMLYAEIFDDIGLYERSVHNWFKYMDIAEFSEMSDCYEGLAVGYMNLGNEQFSAYYYNKLLMESDEVDSATREEILRDFLSAESNPLKFVYPPEIADVSDVFVQGLGYMKQGEFGKAYDEFSNVAEGNPRWGEARNYMAMCLIMQNENAQAEEECLELIRKNPGNVQALTTLAAVKTEAGKKDEAAEITRQLLSVEVSDPDDLYKIATVCCENKFHADAYGLFCKIGAENRYDLNILYFKAISAFNCKKYDECFEAFDTLLTVYPDSVIAQYWYGIARTLKEEGKWEELNYFYTLPQSVKESSVKVLAAYMKLSKARAMHFAAELDITGPVKWCFDENDPSGSEELRYLASRAAVKSCMDDYVRDLLLHPFLSDAIKIDLLEALTERNSDDSFGVVICNVYRRVSVRKLFLNRKRRANFVRAYARLVSHFSILDNVYGERFASAAERVYFRLEREGRTEDSDDVDALTAYVFDEARIDDAGISRKNICAFFEVTEERIQKLKGEQ